MTKKPFSTFSVWHSHSHLDYTVLHNNSYMQTNLCKFAIIMYDQLASGLHCVKYV